MQTPEMMGTSLSAGLSSCPEKQLLSRALPLCPTEHRDDPSSEQGKGLRLRCDGDNSKSHSGFSWGEKVQNVGWEVGEKASLRISSEAVPRD